MSEPKVQISNLYKIFGPSPEQAFELQRGGASKDEIQKKTGDVVAVSDVSFAMDAGEFFVVMGLSGSGKSTLIRCINRLIEPTAGQVKVDDEDVTGMDRNALRRLRLTKMAMVFQQFALLPHRTVGQNAEYGLKIRGVDPAERRKRALEALDLVGLRAWADRPTQDLSGGMQQRVGLARALAVDPEILLMDEPFSALDPLIRRDMQDELLSLQRRFHKTIIFITHDLHEALKLGDRVAIMKEGRFVQVGEPEEIIGGPADPYVAAFTQDVDRGRVLTVETVMRAPEALIAGRDTPETAIRRLRESGRTGLFVVDGDGRPLGVVGARELAQAAKGQSGAAALRSVARFDFASAPPDAKLADIYETCAAGSPLAVLDGDGRLRGVVEPLDVLAELTIRESPARQDEANDRPDAATRAEPQRAAPA